MSQDYFIISAYGSHNGAISSYYKGEYTVVEIECHLSANILPSCLLCDRCRDLNGPVDWHMIRRLGKRAAVVCAPKDMWFPLQHYEQMRDALPELEVRGSWC